MLKLALNEITHKIDNVLELLASSFCESYENRNIGKYQALVAEAVARSVL